MKENKPAICFLLIWNEVSCLGVENELQTNENKALRKTNEPKKNELCYVRYYLRRSFLIYESHLILLGQWNVESYDELGM